MKKVFSVLLSLVMLLSLMSVGVVAVSAASTPDSQVIEATAGETIKIKFVEDDCYGVSCEKIEYSNRNLFSSLSVGGSTQYGKITENSFILSSFDKVTCEVILTVKIAEDAKVGDSCVVSFTGCELVENNEDFSGRSDYTKTVTVKVIKKTTTSSSTSATKPSSSATKPSTSATKPSSSATKPSTSVTKPSSTTGTKVPGVKLDLTELNKQISIAEALNEDEYTADSWAKMESAKKAAVKARKAKTQRDVDKAADALREAILSLVKIDSTQLDQLIDDIKSFLQSNNLTSVWEDLHTALTEAEAALKSGDQAAIDAAYTRLDAAFKALKAQLDKLGEDKVIIQEVEVPIDCDEDCHVWWHWLLLILLPILLVLSIGLNVFFIVLYNKKKKNTTDNTPVVDYDINDD